MMRFVTLFVMAFWAMAAGAEPVSEQGYAVGCDAEGSPLACYVVASGFYLTVMEDGGTPPAQFAALLALPKVTAIAFSGRIGDLGDSSAELVLNSLTQRPDDPYQDRLRAMQGRWRQEGDAGPATLEILGMDWLEFAGDELADALMMTVGPSCADTPAQGESMAITLYRFGDDPAADACWQFVGLEGRLMELREDGKDGAIVRFQRID